MSTVYISTNHSCQQHETYEYNQSVERLPESILLVVYRDKRPRPINTQTINRISSSIRVGVPNFTHYRLKKLIIQRNLEKIDGMDVTSLDKKINDFIKLRSNFVRK